MRFSSKLGLLFVAVSFLGIGCAPRISTNLYARWSQQDQIRRAEMAHEEKIRAEVEKRMGKFDPSTVTGAPAAAAPEPETEKPALRAPATPDIPRSAPVVEESSTTPQTVTTPPIQTNTATASRRAVKPIFQEMEKAEEEEETIY